MTVFVILFENEDGCVKPFQFVRYSLDSAKAAVEKHATESYPESTVFIWEQEGDTWAYSDAPDVTVTWTIYPSTLAS